MKLLFVIDSLNRAGAEQSLVNLVPAIQARGHECHVAALRAPYALAPDLEAAGVTVHRLDLSHPWNLVEGRRKVAALSRTCDAVISHLFLGVVCAALSRTLAPRPLQIAVLHNLDYQVIAHTSPVRRVRKAGHLALLRKQIDAYVAVSHAVAHHYHEHLGEKFPVAVIPNAFPVDHLTPAHTPRRSDSADFLCVVASRMVHQKGHRFLFEALSILKKQDIRPRVLLLGQGVLREELETDVRERGLENQVTFLGAVPHAEAMRLMQSADTVVLPSTHEGFGLAVAEAMLCERPVLATQIGGVEDVVENGVSGILVPPADPPALAQALTELMNDPDLRKKLGRAARARIIERFDAKVVARDWENFLEELKAKSTP